MRYLIGIGNYTGFDDSIGLRVAEAIAEAGLDRAFCAIELGGNVLDIVHYLNADTECVLIIDSARMGLEPGEFAFFEPGQVESRKRLPGVSTHEGDLLKVLELARLLGRPLPPITIMGVEPAVIRTEVGLSTALEGRFERYVESAVTFFEDPA